MNSILNNTLSMKLKRSAALVCAVVVLAACPAMPAWAEDTDVPVDIQIKLLLAALTYEQNIQNEKNKVLPIGFLYFPDIPQSKAQATQFSKSCEEFQDKTVSGRPIKTVLLSYQGSDDLKKKLSEHAIKVLYIANGTKELCTAVTRVTQSAKVLSITSTVAYVTECSISMAVGLQDNRPRIYLNLPASQAEGAAFSSKLLRVVTIIGEVQR